MKSLGSTIAWGFKRVKNSFRNVISTIIFKTSPVKRGRVVMWSYDFKQYSCNPRALTEYLLEHHPEFEIYWVFRKRLDISGVDSRIKCIRFRTLEFLRVINTAEFIITNCRTDPFSIHWKKREGQKYIMQWHGGVALKKIEKDAADKLSFMYLDKAQRDSQACDLMISGCDFQTKLIQEVFWYDGEILEKGIPRNDIFFNKGRHAEIKVKVYRKYDLPEDTRIVLYAPTFRKPVTIEPYRLDWNKVIPAFEKFLGTSKITVMLRLHPNLIGKADTSSLLNHPGMIDVTNYHDMQELLCISDVLITDYSSSMFDFSIMERPCFIFAADLEKYDRGYYFNFNELPYPLARTQEDLIQEINSFSSDNYSQKLKEFMKTKVGLFETGNASKGQAEWMIRHSIRH